MNVICMSTVSSSDQAGCLRIFSNRKNSFTRVVTYSDLANLSYTQCVQDKIVICVIKKSQEAFICHLHSYTGELSIEMLVTRLRHAVALTGLYTNVSPAPREQFWSSVPCTGVSLSRGIEGGGEHCTFTSPTYNTCRNFGL